MSLVNFLYHGPTPKQRFYEPGREIELSGASHQYEGRVEKRSGPGEDEVTHRIDETVSVMFKTKHLESGQRYWTWMNRKCVVLFCASAVGTVIGAIKAFAYANLLPPPYWITALIVKILAVEVFVKINKFTFKRWQQAGEQLQKWKEPVSDIANYRWHLKSKRFSYAYKKQLKNKAVSSPELQDLWKKEIESYRERFREDNPSLDLVEEFLLKGNFGKKGYEYAGFQDGEQGTQSQHFIEEFDRLSGEYARATGLTHDELRECIGNNKKMQELKESRNAILKDYCSKIKELLNEDFSAPSEPSAPLQPGESSQAGVYPNLPSTKNQNRYPE